MAYDKKKIKAEYGAFIKQYSRKKHSGHDPNDRGYSRKLEEKIKRIKRKIFEICSKRMMSN